MSSFHPVRHRLPGNRQSHPAEFLLLAMQRQRQSIFAVQNMGQQPRHDNTAPRKLSRRNFTLFHWDMVTVFFTMTATVRRLDTLDSNRSVWAFPSSRSSLFYDTGKGVGMFGAYFWAHRCPRPDLCTLKPSPNFDHSHGVPSAAGETFYFPHHLW